MANLIVYNASAGSGKTYTLALEYIALCLAEKNPGYFRHILAITFTNKAAHELKERILVFLQTIGEEKAPISASSNQLLVQLDEKLDLSVEEIIQRSAAIHRTMLYRYADLHISTIDSFILGVLRSFSKEIGLPFDFDVELDHNKIIDLLIQNVLSEIGKDSFITEQLIAWSSRKLLEGSTWNPKGNMKQALEALMKEESLPYRTKLLEKGEEGLEAALKEYDKERQGLLKDIRSIQEEVRSRIESTGMSLEDFNRGKGGFISFSFKDYATSDPPTEKHLDIALDGNLLSTIGKKAGMEDAAESIRPLLSSSIIQVREKALRIQEIDRVTKNRMSLILALKLEELVQNLEQEEGMSILSDNNAKVERLIDSNPAPFIYERVGERFKHYLIDEFQDTSLLQWRNMLPLLEESLATAKRSYLVGDAKQSIYRWRGGEVDQLVELPSIPAQKKNRRILELERMLAQNFDQSLSLVKNYRSARSIIEFNNDLFPVLSQELTDRYQEAYSDVKQEHIKSSEGFVRMQRLQDKVKLEEILPNILLQVKECESLGYKGSDICILTRRNADARIIAKCLEDSGRNISSPDALLLKSNANVQLLMCFAEYLSGSESRRPALYIISHLLENHGKSDEISTWHSKLEPKGIDAVLSELMKTLSIEWRKDELIDLGPYSAMIRLIEALSMDLLDPYLQELLNLVAGFGSRQENSLTGLVEYWNDRSDSISVKAGVNPNSIQIMTIHKSKGLQFPVVIIPLVDWKSGRNGKTKEWIEPEGIGLEVSLIDLTNKLEDSPYAELIRKEKDKSALDKMNLLYVALTRAEEQLYVNISDPGSRGLGQSLCAYLDQKTSEGLYERGSQKPKSLKGKSESSQDQLADYPKNRKTDLLTVVLSKIDSQRRERAFGDAVHTILEQELEGAELDRFILSTSLEEENIKLREAVTNARQLEKQLDIPTTAQARSEVSLMDGTGRSYRIDKLYLDNERKKAWIIDYKTGKQKDEDIIQIQGYRELLRNMGYQDIDAFLIYTEEQEIVAA